MRLVTWTLPSTRSNPLKEATLCPEQDSSDQGRKNADMATNFAIRTRTIQFQPIFSTFQRRVLARSRLATCGLYNPAQRDLLELVDWLAALFGHVIGGRADASGIRGFLEQTH